MSVLKCLETIYLMNQIPLLERLERLQNWLSWALYSPSGAQHILSCDEDLSNYRCGVLWLSSLLLPNVIIIAFTIVGIVGSVLFKGKRGETQLKVNKDLTQSLLY